MPSKKENFAKYPNPYFIETGSFLGDGIRQALDAGFDKIVSIELSDKYHQICEFKFQNNNNVEILKGDSYKILPSVINKINDKITFWLDGHYSCEDTALGDHWSPLIQELDVIKSHHIKDHVIMIDDMRCWELPNPVHGFFKDDIINKLLEINPDYKFTYEDGIEKNDILVAHI